MKSGGSSEGGLFSRVIPYINARRERQAALDKSARLYGSDPETGKLPSRSAGQRAFRRSTSI